MRFLIWVVALLVVSDCVVIRAQSNGPQVSIVWPTSPFPLSAPMCIKIQADASSPGGSITNVEFLVNQTNRISLVTDPPFSLIWDGVITNLIYDGSSVVLTAVASDSAGNNTTSAPVTVYSVLRPPYPILEMIGPTNGALFATTDTIELAAELLASATCNTGPEEFFVGTNSVGMVNTNGSNEMFTISTPPFSVTVSNLAEGDYDVGVRMLDLNGGYCECGSVKIRVLKLGLVSPKIQADGSLTFEVVTSFAGKQNVIEASTNLMNWSPISTNQPSVSRFTFRATPPADRNRFYRVSVPSQ